MENYIGKKWLNFGLTSLKIENWARFNQALKLMIVLLLVAIQNWKDHETTWMINMLFVSKKNFWVMYLYHVTSPANKQLVLEYTILVA